MTTTTTLRRRLIAGGLLLSVAALALPGATFAKDGDIRKTASCSGARCTRSSANCAGRAGGAPTLPLSGALGATATDADSRPAPSAGRVWDGQRDVGALDRGEDGGGCGYGRRGRPRRRFGAGARLSAGTSSGVG